MMQRKSHMGKMLEREALLAVMFKEMLFKGWHFNCFEWNEGVEVFQLENLRTSVISSGKYHESISVSHAFPMRSDAIISS